MVILVIHINCVRAVKFECYTPVSANPHRPNSTIFPFQFMQVQAREIHILRVQRGMQPGQCESQLRSVRRPYPSLAAAQKEAFKSLVSEAPNHLGKCNVLRNRCQGRQVA